MAGTVTSNLTLVDAADAITGWAFGTDTTASVFGAIITETLLRKQGSACNKIQSPTAVGNASMVVQVTAVDLTGATLYCWMSFNSLYLMPNLSSSGMRITIASGASPGVNWGEWYVGGRDVYGNFLGTTAATKQAGWTCFAIDCNRPFDAVAATAPTKTAITAIGIGAAFTGSDPSGNALDAFYWDVIRHDNRLGLGGGLTITNGTTASPATFQDLYNADNDSAGTNAYGIVKKAVGAFALQGPITIGTTAQAAVTTFTDSSQIVLWDDAQVRNSGIYGITLNGAASFPTTVTWGQFSSNVASKGISILSPGNSLYTTIGASGGKNAAGYGSLSTTAGSTITRTVGDWTKDGYVAGALVTTSGFTTAANNGIFHITAATATALTISETTLVTEAGATTRTVNGIMPLRWDLVVNANSTLNAYSSTFNGMGRGTLNSTCALRSCTITNFGDITPAGATIDNCKFSDVNTFVPISGTYALVINATTDVTSKITNSSFTNCNRAMKITTAGSYTFSNLTFSGNTFDIVNASGGAVTINATSGANPATFANAVTAAAVVAGGTGYAATNVLTVVGGTGTAAQLTVTTVSAGVITAVSVSTAGEYTVNPTNPVSVTGGAGTGATFNLTIGTTTINNAVNITVTVIDEAGALVGNTARVAVYRSSSIADGTELLLANTVSGVATTTFNYLVDTAITVRVRMESPGATKYFPYQATGTITSTGFSTTVTLIKDLIVAP